MTLRAITFDAGGTLLYPHPSVGHIYAETAVRHGLHVSADAMEMAFRHAWTASHHPDSASAATTVSQFVWWRQLVFRALDHVGGTMKDREAYFLELYELFAKPAVWRLFPDALDTLAAVKQLGFKVGLLSNWDHRLRPVLEGLGVTAYLDATIISCEVGAEKPHAKIFQAAASALDVNEPGELLHVGDSYREDVLGATALGMRAVLVERAGPSQWDGPRIRELDELLTLLNGPPGASNPAVRHIAS